MEGGSGSNGGLLFTLEKDKNLAFFQTHWRTIEKAHFLTVLAAMGSAPGLQSKFIKNFLKILLKINSKWIILMKFSILISRFFEIFLQFYRNFRENLGKIQKILEICICKGFGGQTPEAREIIKKLVEKSMETCKCLKIFMNYEYFFYLKR